MLSLPLVPCSRFGLFFAATLLVLGCAAKPTTPESPPSEVDEPEQGELFDAEQDPHDLPTDLAELLDESTDQEHELEEDQLDDDAQPLDGIDDSSDDDSAQTDEDASDDSDSELIPACPNECTQLDLWLGFGSRSERLERAYFGLETDEQQRSSLYLEAYAGAEEGCPEATSPTPNYTLIVSNWPLEASEHGSSQGLSATFLDFRGDLLDQVLFSKALSVSLRRIEACEACANWPSDAQRDGIVAVDFEAVFAEGRIEGRLVASHCASLDWP